MAVNDLSKVFGIPSPTGTLDLTPQFQTSPATGTLGLEQPSRLKRTGSRISNNLARMGGYDPMQLSNAEERKRARLAGLQELSYRLSQTAAKLSGDPARMQIAQQQEAARQPKAVKPPVSYQEYALTDSTPTPQEYAEWMLEKETSKSPMVSINQEQESEFIKRSVELGTDDIKESRKSFAASSELLPKVETAQTIMQSPNFVTGPSQEITLPLRRLYNDITGQDQEKVSQQELFNAMANYSIPRMRPPGSGATSDFEANLFSQATIGLGNSKEGNELIAGTMVQQGKRDRILLDLKEDYYKKNQGDTTGFEKYLRDNNLVPSLYQQLNLNQQNLGEMYDQGKIKNGEVYIDLTNPRSPQLTVFRLSDFD